MTSFFEHQDRARRNTRLLLWFFGLAVLGIALSIYVLVWFLEGSFFSSAELPDKPWFEPTIFLGTVLGTLAFVSAASFARSMSLRGGGGARVAEMLGGRLLSAHPKDGLERRLLNVVEEMAIASGVPVPQVFVLDDEPSINAFAAGFSTDDAAVAVTRGGLEKLSRSELQGVIAHEFSHILNGDMRLNMRLLGVLFGILCIGLGGRLLMRLAMHARLRGSRQKDNSTLLLLLGGLALLLIGTLGELFGRLIKAAVSRQREFLADASAVQFTRDPQSIAGALKKIGGYSEGAKIQSARAEEASHFFFGDIHPSLFGPGLLATHPPLSERIKRVDPSFDGKFAKVGPGVLHPADDSAASAFAAGPSPTRTSPASPAAGPSPSALAAGSSQAGRTLAEAGLPSRDPSPAQVHDHEAYARAVVAQVGTVSPEALDHGRALLRELPEALRDAAHHPFSACALVYALLLSDDATIREAQRAQLDGLAGSRLLAETSRLLAPVQALARRARLPLVELLAPALRELSREQRESFTRTVQALITANSGLSIFEYVLAETLRARLSDAEHAARRARRTHRSLKAVHKELELVLSLLAHAGGTGGQRAGDAFSLAAAQLPELALTLLAPSERLLPALGPALRELAALPPALSERVVTACAQAVLEDRHVSDDEDTLLRAVCDALGCPLPALP